MLRLPGRLLIDRVRDVERRPRRLEVHVKGVEISRLRIEAIKDREAVACVVNRLEFWRIEEAIGPQPAQREKVSDGMRSGADVGLDRRALERSISERHTASRLREIQPRFRDDVNDETALVAIFGRRHAGDQFHRLHRILRDLVRIDPALLIGHRLVVDGKLRLRVVANRMKEAIRIRDDPG